jgi:two-component system LytT family response regulator
MIKSLIVDDEKNSRELLKNLLEKNCPLDIEIVGLAENIDKAEAIVRSQNPQLIFLDIELSGNTGFDLLEKIQDLKFDVIFTTAFDHYALRAIKYSALDYLLKPIDLDELKLAIEKIKAKQNKETSLNQLQLLLQNFKQPDNNLNKISLPTIHGHEIIYLKDIIRLESEDHYTTFFTIHNKKYMVSSTLRHYEEMLPQDKFFRLHNSHIINTDHVSRITKEGFVMMVDGSTVEVSRRKKDLLNQKIGIL